MHQMTIAVATYNRIEYLRILSKSLAACKLIAECNLRIYDDCSSALSDRDLRDLFPDAQEIIVRERNLGADGHLHQIYLDFLKTEDELLVVIDSDLICNPGFVEFIVANIDRTDGMMSLYNSISHDPIDEYDEVFLLKAHVGSAGTVFKREIVKLIIANEQLDYRTRYDWEWSAYLTGVGIRLFVTRESLVQHIGIYGQNCNGIETVQIGADFKPVSMINYDALLETYEKIIENYRHILLSDYEVFKKTRDYRLGHWLLSPLRKIKQVLRHLS